MTQHHLKRLSIAGLFGLVLFAFVGLTGCKADPKAAKASYERKFGEVKARLEAYTTKSYSPMQVQQLRTNLTKYEARFKEAQGKSDEEASTAMRNLVSEMETFEAELKKWDAGAAGAAGAKVPGGKMGAPGTAPAGGKMGATAPAGTAPAGTAPAGGKLGATAPAGTAPAGTAPAGTAPAGTAPAGTAPAGGKLGGTAPAGTAPAGTAPAGTKTAPAGGGSGFGGK